MCRPYHYQFLAYRPHTLQYVQSKWYFYGSIRHVTHLCYAILLEIIKEERRQEQPPTRQRDLLSITRVTLTLEFNFECVLPDECCRHRDFLLLCLLQFSAPSLFARALPSNFWKAKSASPTPLRVDKLAPSSPTATAPTRRWTGRRCPNKFV